LRAFLKFISATSRFERIALAVLACVLLASFYMLQRSFYRANTVEVPVPGGTYIEGSVGDVQPLNPWFTTTNDVNRDIESLVFSGLLRYDTGSGKIVEDLATMTISKDNRIYTLRLKDNLLWHDSTKENPHPVSVDDVLYTFKTIQEPDFPNPILHQNFRGVAIDKLDDRTVRFTLEKPYAFFTSNLTLGLVPKRAFEGVPVKKLAQTLDFGLHPIGAGPYSFLSLVQTDLSTEVTLKRFPRPGLTEYRLDRIVFRVFPDYTTLLSDIINTNGVRVAPRNAEGQPILPHRFTAVPYTLPQYVGLFFNLDREFVKDKNLRVGLQLATNKQEVTDAINEIHVVDTPLLEIDLGDWRYKFDAQAAQGALFESNWNMPEKIRLQRLLERREANDTGILRVPPVALLQTGAMLTMTGAMPERINDALKINGILGQTGTVVPGVPQGSGSWVIRLPTDHASGALKLGVNLLKLVKDDGGVLDSAYVERVSDSRTYRLAMVEQGLVDRFLASKKLTAGDPQRITIDSLYMENGYLRLKVAGDAPHTRVNQNGRPLKLTILTSDKPEAYRVVAEIIRKNWEAVGVDVTIDVPATRKEFEDRMLTRDYDVLLFGQSLLDNLDSYPFWHSSQTQELGDKKNLKLDAFNLSQYASFEADSLLTQIRETSDIAKRARSLDQLNAIIKRDVPAVFLYSPLYVFAYDNSVRGIKIGKLASHSDRFLSLHDWYINTKRQFKPGKSWLSMPSWMLNLSN
jgi:ABC-type transport system substrate-binding protein